MKLHTEKIKCALPTSPRLQPERSLLLLMGFREVFRSMETKEAASSSLSLFLSACGTTSSGGGRGQVIHLTVRADHC